VYSCRYKDGFFSSLATAMKRTLGANVVSTSYGSLTIRAGWRKHL
jgi:hypothetical protein